ncbi:MAG TPA: hypothetical protein VGI95_01465 [Caulobacteraceae bacterium]|jgi:hypothetical protein
MWRAALASVSLLVLAQRAEATAALPAPSLYVTHNHGLAIVIPQGLTYCPLPPDWVGSDHGVDLYLAPPANCGDAGYPSSDRDATPRTPMIEVFYEFNTDDYVDRPRCRTPVRLRTLGRWVRACRRTQDGWTVLEAHPTYFVGREPHDLVLTLTTTEARYVADLASFVALARGVRACHTEWADGRQGACPKSQWF